MQNNNENVGFKRNSDLVYRINKTILAVGGDCFNNHRYVWVIIEEKSIFS